MVEQVRELLALGWDKQAIANKLGVTRSKVRRLCNKHDLERNEAMAALGITRDVCTDAHRDIELKVPGMVSTEAEAIAASGIDPNEWDVVGCEFRYYPLQVGGGKLEQGTYVKMRLSKRKVIRDADAVAALVDGVLAAREHRPPTLFKGKLLQRTGRLGLIVLNDPHFGKLCWGGNTGESNWNLRIAQETVTAAVEHLLDRLPPCDRILFSLLGDVFHYDTLQGTTTSGTQMDRDSRIALMLEVGAETIASGIRRASGYAPTSVLTVPGNHDAVLTLALQRILTAEFRDTSVKVDGTYTRRKPFLWGRTLLQFDHGDKARKKLAHMLPQEHPKLWGESVYREIHTGHLHTDAELANASFVEQGVLVRTHPALCPSDLWHFDEGFTGSPRAMQAFVYHDAGALEQVVRFDPRVHLEAA